MIKSRNFEMCVEAV